MTDAERIIKVRTIFDIDSSVPDNMLIDALTTPSYGHENYLHHQDVQEYLALIGDAIIDIVVIEYLMKKGLTDPGQITIEKSELVGVKRQTTVAARIGLQDYMIWGIGELREEQLDSRRRIGECLEAIIGAVYLATHRVGPCERSLAKINYFKK